MAIMLFVVLTLKREKFAAGREERKSHKAKQTIEKLHMSYGCEYVWVEIDRKALHTLGGIIVKEISHTFTDRERDRELHTHTRA